MTVTIGLRQLMLSAGQSVLLSGITWSEFEDVLVELGEHRASKITYDRELL